jgi:hypothetical protein
MENEAILRNIQRQRKTLTTGERKTGKFMPEHLGQLEFYLEALDRDIKKPNENPSVVGTLNYRYAIVKATETKTSQGFRSKISIFPYTGAGHDFLPRYAFAKTLNSFTSGEQVKGVF